MSWNEEINNITTATLFKFFSKFLLAAAVWIILMYIIIFIPVIALMLFLQRFMPY